MSLIAILRGSTWSLELTLPFEADIMTIINQAGIKISMKYRNIGGLKISVLGIGGLHFGNYCDQETTNHIVHAALDSGINLIDTAPMYGNALSEEYIAAALKGRRTEAVIATKVGLVPVTNADGAFSVAVAPLNKKNIRENLEKSLRNLQTDYIDLYQVHAFDNTTPVAETLDTLKLLVREGKTRFIGCSNYLKGELEKTATAKGGTPFISFQAHYNMIERRAETEVLPECRKAHVGMICNRPLARGILTGKYRAGALLPEGSRAVSSYRIRRWLSEPTLELVAGLQKWSAMRGHSVTELAIAWLLAQPGVASVLNGVRNLTQLEENIRAVNWALTRNELEEIDGIINSVGLMVQVGSMPETLFET